MKVAELPTVASTFQEMKSRAESRWQELWDSGKPVIMVGAATCRNGVLVQGPQPGSGLTRIQNLHTGPVNGLHVTSRCRRDP